MRNKLPKICFCFGKKIGATRSGNEKKKNSPGYIKPRGRQLKERPLKMGPKL